MPNLKFNDQIFQRNDGESVLDCLLRHNINVSYSCKSGVCQTCLLQSVGQTPTENSQVGLKDTLRAQSYFLSCICVPAGDFQAKSLGQELLTRATITALKDLGNDVLQIYLKPESKIEYRAGQYISLIRADGLARSYSVASLPVRNEIELHVRVRYPGKMSYWLKSEARIGETVHIRGPSGNCFYMPDNLDQPLLLIGTGTGLAPLYGILQDALAHHHRGPITLYHGALNPSGLYLVNELETIAEQYSQFNYFPCVLDQGAKTSPSIDKLLLGSLDSLILERHRDWEKLRIYICGDPKIVSTLQRSLFLEGAKSKEIFTDAFLPSIN